MAQNEAAGRYPVLATQGDKPSALLALENGQRRKLAGPNAPWLREVTLCRTDEASFPSIGRPEGEESHEFHLDQLLFAANTYAVRNARYRGSSCRGTVHSKATSANWGPWNSCGLDKDAFQYDRELGPPRRSQDLWVKLSYPFFRADRIHTPALFLCGDKDMNVPLAGGEQMYEALRSLGVPAELIIYPGAFHGITRPSYVKDRLERYLAWYGK